MTQLAEKLRAIPLGGWVLVALMLASISSALVKENADETAVALRDLRPRIDPAVQAVLYSGEPASQAFTSVPNREDAEKLRDAIVGADKLKEARAYHCLDVIFMICYGPLLVLGALWGRKRARLLKESDCGVRSTIGKILGWLWPVALVSAVIGVAGDLGEYLACVKMLNSPVGTRIEPDWVTDGALATHLKWVGVNTSSSTGLLLGVVASFLTPAVLALFGRVPESWELIVRAHRFATRARFSVLAGALFTVLLLTGPGEDIVRTVATGAFKTEPLDPMMVPAPDFERLGWFAVALLTLAATCWGWARLVLAVRFTKPEERSGQLDDDLATRHVEDRLRRDLPIYYGAVPFVAAASAFAIAPLYETSAKFLTVRFFAASVAPLLLFFVLPFLLVVLRADTKTSRNSVGPLSWTLIGYCVLALVHALIEWNDLHLLGLIPLVLLGVALLLFGLGRPAAIFALPVALLWGAHGLVLDALSPAIVLVVLGWLAFWAARNAHGMDELNIPKSFSTGDLLRLALFGSCDEQIKTAIRSDEPVVQEMREQQQRPPPTLNGEPKVPLEPWAVAIKRLRGLLRLCGLLTAVQILLFLVVLLMPQSFPRAIGSGAMVALGLAGWATAGSALVFTTQATRFPILGAALLLAVLCSGLMDNHQIRLADRTATKEDAEKAAHFLESTRGQSRPNQDPVGDAFESWHHLATKGPVAGHEPPCIIVAAEGGGIRAAFWPAIVLSTLQSRSLALADETNRPDFTSHVFAISGVSGGSVGAAVFEALCAEKRDEPKLRELAAKVCGEDHLAPTLGALLYPDFAQRFMPFACLPDRARAFETSWENATSSLGGSARMARPFTALWNPGPTKWLPALFLNATMVETGKRIICSGLPVCTAGGGRFIDAHDFYAHLREFGPGAGGWRDVPLSAAAHASARFPIVSPPGRLPSGTRVVDGGYFENSAATTGIDLLNAVTARRDKIGATTPLIFIFTRYADKAGMTDSLTPPVETPSPPIPDEDSSVYLHKNLLNETGAIGGTLLATRSARGSYAQHAVFDRYLASRKTIVLSFTFRGENIPLSWSLSQRSCIDMLKQFPADPTLLYDGDPATKQIIESNLAAGTRLFDALYGK